MRPVLLVSILLPLLASCQTLTKGGEGPISLTAPVLWLIQDAQLDRTFLALSPDGRATGGAFCIRVLSSSSCGDTYTHAVETCEATSHGRKCGNFVAEGRVIWDLPSRTRSIDHVHDGHWRSLQVSVVGGDQETATVSWSSVIAGEFSTPQGTGLMAACTGQLQPGWFAPGRWQMYCENGESVQGVLAPSNGAELIGHGCSKNGLDLEIVVQ